jgi:hypothetical protein
MTNRFKALVGGILLVVLMIATSGSYPAVMSVVGVALGVALIGTALLRQNWPD